MQRIRERDRALRRVSLLTRSVVAGSVALSGVFTAVIALTRPAHSKKVAVGARAIAPASRGRVRIAHPVPPTTPRTVPRAVGPPSTARLDTSPPVTSAPMTAPAATLPPTTLPPAQYVPQAQPSGSGGGGTVVSGQS